MRKLFILLGLFTVLFLVSETRAQTKIVFDRGASSKTLTITVPAGGSRSFSVAVNRNQVVNVDVSGDIAVSKSNDFPVISVNLSNGADGIDYWQDGEGYLSVLTGRKGVYIFSVSNSSKRARTFSMRVAVTSDRDDYRGGTD